VFTNTGIVIFAANIFADFSQLQKWMMFLAIEHGVLLVKAILSEWIPDFPEEVEQGQIWGKRVVNERLYGKPADLEEQRR
jgi:hypothetical protein